MFVVARSRREGGSKIHYLPEGRVMRVGDDVLLSRTGNYVIVQTEREKYGLEAPGSINLTEKLLHFVPFDAVVSEYGKGDPVEVLGNLEKIAWGRDMPAEVRRFVRLYAALFGLRIMDDVPGSYGETVVLTVSRLTGEAVDRVVAERKRLEERLRGELEDILKAMEPEQIALAVAVLQPMDESTLLV